MATLREWVSRLWGTLRPGRDDRELEQELRLHLELAAEDARRRGSAPERALRAARIHVGGTAQAMEALRDQRGLPWLEDLARDVRHALRLLRRNPVFAGSAVVLLALGIGANTAIFSLLDAVMLRLLPVREAARLVQLVRQQQPYGRGFISYPLYERFRDDVPSLDGVFAQAWPDQREISLDGQLETVNMQLVSDNYYTVLGVSAVAGRTFLAEVDRAAGPQAVAVIGHGFWRRRFGADPAVVGKTFRLNQTVFTIVGVTPPEFFGAQAGRAPDVTLPLTMDGAARGAESWLAKRHYNWLSVMGRLREDRSLAQAQAEVITVFSRVKNAEAGRAARETDRKEILEQSVALQPAGGGFDELRQQFSEPLQVLMAAVALVLLIACTSLAILLLARAATREQEMAVRLALGAGRGRVVRQLLAEGLVLAGLGGTLGVLLASWFANGLITMMSNDGPRIALEVRPDVRLLGFAALVSGTSCLVFSAAPALLAARAGRQGLARARTSSRWRFGPSLVAAQIAVSVVLLIGAGLFGRTLLHMYTLDAGFARDGVLLFRVDAAKAGYAGDRLRAVQPRILEEVDGLPGVASASLVLYPPVSGGGWEGNVYVEGRTNIPGEDARAHLNAAGPRYFATLDTPVIAGREFTGRDGPASPTVAVINETFARYYFGERSPLGRWLSLGDPGRARIEIVGVVKDMKYQSLRQTVPRTVFFAVQQAIASRDASTYVARTQAGPAEAASSIAAALGRVDPALRATEMRSLRDHVASSLLQERLLATLTGWFGLLSLVLVGVGVYGVVAFQAGRRTKEIGIRMALGARPRQVLALMLGETAVPVLAGASVGVAAALQFTRVTRTLLFGVTPTDPATFAGAWALLVALALAAAWVPGRRAARLNPARTLRSE
jgi:putative ABC transport system permease protein